MTTKTTGTAPERPSLGHSATDPRAATDPVVYLGHLLGAMDSLHNKLDEKSVAAFSQKRKGEPDHLGHAVATMSSALDAIRDAISYLPAASPTGALVHVMLAGVAADQSRGGEDEGGCNAERAERHIEAALPVLAEALGVNLAVFNPQGFPILLPDLLRAAYMADVHGPLAVMASAEARS